MFQKIEYSSRTCTRTRRSKYANRKETEMKRNLDSQAGVEKLTREEAQNGAQIGADKR